MFFLSISIFPLLLLLIIIIKRNTINIYLFPLIGLGISKKSMEAIHLDEDWDPEKYDKEMEQMFNDDYFEGGRLFNTVNPSILIYLFTRSTQY